MRRLTRFEYSNTVRDLLGDTTRPGNTFPPEEIGNGFGNDANAVTVSYTLAEKYYDSARGIAERLVADRPRWAQTLGCDPTAMGEDACARAFIDRFGARAFRRPLSDEERDQLLGVYTSVRATELQTFDSAASAVVEAALQMPQFLYRVELYGPSVAEGIAVLDGHEMASRLSYLLWGSMPDEALFAAAQNGQLSTKEEIAAQADRMLNAPRARDVVRFFNATLFGLVGVPNITRDTAMFPTFTAEIPGLLQQETLLFLDDVIWERRGTLKTLLTADWSFMNDTLARYYGVDQTPGAPTTSAFARITLDPKRTAGFMTRGALMAALTPGSSQTNPVLRGKFVLTKLLCKSPPPPPSGFTPMPPAPDLTLTTRERFAAHTNNDACAGCHKALDPLGFAFEHYDQIGRWRALDNNKPVDATGTVSGIGIEGSFNDAVGLAAMLAESESVSRCYVGQWQTFAYGRAHTEADACTKSSLEDAFKKSGGNIRELLIALTQTDAFLYRRVQEASSP